MKNPASFMLIACLFLSPFAARGGDVRMDPALTEMGALCASSSGGGLSLEPGFTAIALRWLGVRPDGKSRKFIRAEEGGKVAGPGNHAVTLPPGALSVSAEITVAAREGGPKDLSPLVEFGPEGTRFDKPVTIEIVYDPLRLEGRSEEDLKIFHWNPISAGWEAMASTVDRPNKAVSAQVTHFSLYQVHAQEKHPPEAPGPDKSFKLGEVYSFPNPAAGNRSPTIHVECGFADSIAIKIHDETGIFVHETKILQEPGIIKGKYAYEYAWDASHVPSGIYLYIVEAKKSGAPPLKRIGKLAILK